MIGLAALAQAETAAAQSAYDYPWCALRGGRGGGQSCYYKSYAQCMESLRGIGGSCINSPYYRGGARAERRYYRSY